MFRYLEHFLWNYPQVNTTRSHWWLINTGSGNGLVPSGNKPLPELILTKLCCHTASLGQNVLINTPRASDAYMHQWSGSWLVNSLAPGKLEWHFRYLIFQIISVLDDLGIFCEIALRWMSLDLSDDKSTLVQVMAWCRQATSHYYLSQWWPRSLSPYCVTRPQWVKVMASMR